MGTPAPLLKLVNVTRSYAPPDGGASLVVLDGVSLEAASGESLAIVGPSGSGKSTLLHIMGTLDQPTSGEALLDGRNLAQLTEKEVAAVRNTEIGFVFQAHYLLPQCTVLENVLVPTLACSRRRQSAHSREPAEQRRLTSATTSEAGLGLESRSGALPAPSLRSESAEARATRLLARVGLAERMSHRPAQLSGGECQRVAVVRALINRPRLLLADEPTGALDHASAQQLGQLLVELNREEGVTLIIVTHSLELAGRMGRVFELRDGKLGDA